MKFQDKFYDMIGHNKCPSSEKSAEKCIFRKSYFHHSEPSYITNNDWLFKYITLHYIFSKVGGRLEIFAVTQKEAGDYLCKSTTHGSLMGGSNVASVKIQKN